MTKSSEQHPFEVKARAMAEGFRGFPMANTELVFRGESMLPSQAADRFQQMAESFQRVREAKGAHQAASDDLARSMDDFHSFYEEAVVVVKSHFGSDHKRLGTFGIGGLKKARRMRGEREVVRTTVVDEVILGPGRVPEVEVVETTEVIETGRGGRRPHRERRPRAVPRATTPSTPGLPVTTKPKQTATKRGGSR